MRAARWLTGAAAAALALAACAPPSPTTALAPGQIAAADKEAAQTTFVMALENLGERYLAANPEPSLIDADATPDVATHELAQELKLEGQARDFVAALAFDLNRRAGETKTRYADLSVEVAKADAYADGDTPVLVLRTRSDGVAGGQDAPTTSEAVDYALSLDGPRILSIQAVTEGDRPALDGGVGLHSVTGAVERFLALVRDRDNEAVSTFSGGVNNRPAELEVLRSVLLSTSEYRLVELPSAREGAQHTVYAVADGGGVIGRFLVTTQGSGRPLVTYVPTA